MAVTTPYATVVEYLAVVDAEDSEADLSAIQRALLQASRMIDRHCGRFFSKEATATARTYRAPAGRGGRFGSEAGYGRGPIGWAESENPFLYSGWSRSLPIDDLSAAPTQVVIDQNGDGSLAGETPVDPTWYELQPLNALTGPEPRPYLQFAIPPSSPLGGFSAQQLVQITGVWGWPAVPEPINRVCIQLAGALRLAWDASQAGVVRVGVRPGPDIQYGSAADSGLPLELLNSLNAYRKAPLL